MTVSQWTHPSPPLTLLVRGSWDGVTQPSSGFSHSKLGRPAPKLVDHITSPMKNANRWTAIPRREFLRPLIMNFSIVADFQVPVYINTLTFHHQQTEMYFWPKYTADLFRWCFSPQTMGCYEFWRVAAGYMILKPMSLWYPCHGSCDNNSVVAADPLVQPQLFRTGAKSSWKQFIHWNNPILLPGPADHIVILVGEWLKECFWFAWAIAWPT